MSAHWERKYVLRLFHHRVFYVIPFNLLGILLIVFTITSFDINNNQRSQQNYKWGCFPWIALPAYSQPRMWRQPVSFSPFPQLHGQLCNSLTSISTFRTLGPIENVFIFERHEIHSLSVSTCTVYAIFIYLLIRHSFVFFVHYRVFTGKNCTCKRVLPVDSGTSFCTINLCDINWLLALRKHTQVLKRA